MAMSTQNMVTQDIGISIKLVSEKLIELVTKIGYLAVKCIYGMTTLFISSGDKFEVNWIIFKLEITTKLKKLYIENNVKKITGNAKMHIVTKKLNENIKQNNRTDEGLLTNKN